MYLSSCIGITFIQVFLYACKKYIRQVLKATVSPQGNTFEHFSQKEIHRLLHTRLIECISVWILSHGQKKKLQQLLAVCLVFFIEISNILM